MISVATILHCLYVLRGVATHWPEYLAYNLETDDEEKMQEIKNAAVPYNTVGLLEVSSSPSTPTAVGPFQPPPRPLLILR